MLTGARGNATLPHFDDKKVHEIETAAHEQNEYSDPESYDDEEETCDPYLDEKNIDKPQMMPIYAERVHAVLKSMEEDLILTRSQFLRAQAGGDVSLDVRNRGVAFMIELGHAYTVDPATLSNAVFLIDRILTQMQVPRPELKLMCAVCVWMSTKAHELEVPLLEDINDMCEITKKGDYQPYELWERKIFIAHNFNVMYPTVQFFLGRCLNYVDADSRLTDVAHFLSEASLLSFQHNEFARSKLAFSIVLSAAALIDFPIRILFFMACAHLSDYSDVLSCCDFVLGLASHIAGSRSSPTYVKHIQASPQGSVLRTLNFDVKVLDKIRNLLDSTKLVLK